MPVTERFNVGLYSGVESTGVSDAKFIRSVFTHHIIGVAEGDLGA